VELELRRSKMNQQHPHHKVSATSQVLAIWSKPSLKSIEVVAEKQKKDKMNTTAHHV
jgi:hypothetical protein